MQTIISSYILMYHYERPPYLSVFKCVKIKPQPLPAMCFFCVIFFVTFNHNTISKSNFVTFGSLLHRSRLVWYIHVININYYTWVLKVLLPPLFFTSSNTFSGLLWPWWYKCFRLADLCLLWPWKNIIQWNTPKDYMTTNYATMHWSVLPCLLKEKKYKSFSEGFLHLFCWATHLPNWVQNDVDIMFQGFRNHPFLI